MSTTTVQPEKILKDLQKLWIDLGKEDSQKGAAGVLRACAMTLIATVEQEADAQSSAEAIAEIMHQHPSRVIVMRLAADQPNALEARVFAQCWMPFGRRQQICCEEIEITASESRLDDLPKLVLGLTAPDLPVVVWCRGERLLKAPAFHQLFGLSEKVIVDSCTFAHPADALQFIRDLTEQGRNVADLSWTRLTALREVIAQIFDSESRLASLKTLQKVTVSYEAPQALPPAQTPTPLRYITSWFQTTLATPVEVSHVGVAPAYALKSIQLAGPGFVAVVTLQDGVADVDVNGMVTRIALPHRVESDLLREELSIIGVDVIYRRCLG